MKVNWSDFNKIKKIIAQSNSKKETLTTLGFNYHSIHQHRKLVDFIEEHGVDISHFNKIPKHWKSLPDIINQCNCYSDVLKLLNLSVHGSNTETVKKYIELFNLDISHFNKSAGGSTPTYTNEEIFCKNSPAQKGTMRTRYLKLRESKYYCDSCNLTTWKDAPITLEIDHKNGVPSDHRLNNLRLLCPNCHSQTETYGSKRRLTE